MDYPFLYSDQYVYIYRERDIAIQIPRYFSKWNRGLNKWVDVWEENKENDETKREKKTDTIYDFINITKPL